MALMSTDVMVNEIANRLGPRTDVAGVEGTPPAGRIIRAINDAVLELVLSYRIPQYEAFPPWYITSQILTSYTATNSADGVSVTMSANMNTAFATTWGAQCFCLKFDDSATYHQILSVSGGGSDVLTVSPRVTTAHAGAATTIVQTMWPFPPAASQTAGGQTAAAPADVYAIVDVRDMEQGRKIKHQDIRGIDKVQPIHGSPAFYSRWKDYLLLHPFPATPNVKYQIRYLQRPQYTANAATTYLTPLPEEWQENVINLAVAKCLAAQGEEQRAAWYMAQVDARAQALRSSYADSADDFSFSVGPSPSFIRGLRQ